ncbi:dUTP diphosphatase [Helicobacter mustelae]|uniref:Deoxyuridine 5'-triphosphate nucleotidohydrolase n=1 Tax=Helicobacter mustelae (strain ATCC 43772 / CCUG 25715 / CIP 103759 / LMG 18044 / NCTC 12198 / R85-136P) TaxID=679897 RepID=D3UI37_HELM1|nr:dUTP diphosphatase [Helicobacter mustelae]CBG40160.1 deoxyuridine 5'-triphosphate nucleotidohydrolase [Helicobacter mustelae 12198]SQH71662.1 deoxyuridine 5'-triphosphate nucleotidohydrolase [Helicobacter mustelae]STP12787.1 deoxyuridine 5'-triphosphate nucleotidohydrolase [Helicobacter mustelae]
MQVKIKKIHPDAKIPLYQTQGAAGFDLQSIEEVVIPAHSHGLVKTGLCIQVPEGYELQVRPRSGLAFKSGITVLNSPGTIDSDYRGEIMVILYNSTKEDFFIAKGDRIAQGVISQYAKVEFDAVEDLDPSPRGEKGLGSTGI